MKMIQIVGPIKKWTVETISPPDNNCTFVHIGLHIPKQWPVKDLEEKDSSPWIQVLGLSSKPGTIYEHKYLLNEHNVLEFDGVEEEEFTIEALRDLPPETVIDVVYTTLEDE